MKASSASTVGRLPAQVKSVVSRNLEASSVWAGRLWSWLTMVATATRAAMVASARRAEAIAGPAARQVAAEATRRTAALWTLVSSTVAELQASLRPTVRHFATLASADSRRAAAWTTTATRRVASVLSPAVHRLVPLAAGAARSAGNGFIYLIQRSEVALKRLDRRSPFVVIGLAGVLALAAVAVPGFTRDDASTTRQASGGVELAPAFVLERISHGRNGNIFALVAGQPLFPLPPVSLTRYAGAPVEMQDAPVHQIVSENGMWVGESTDQRVFVTLSKEAIADGFRLPSTFAPGERLNLSGRMVPAEGFERLGVAPEEGLEQLFGQRYMIEAVSVRPPTPRPDYPQG